MYNVYVWMVKPDSVHYLLMIISKGVFITFVCVLKEPIEASKCMFECDIFWYHFLARWSNRSYTVDMLADFRIIFLVIYVKKFEDMLDIIYL